MAGIMLPFFGSTAGRQSQPDPGQIPSLNLWYNASASATNINGVSTNNFNTAVVNTTPISAWSDLSGTGHPANVTGGNGPRPTYATNIENGLGMLQYTAANSSNLDINPISWAQSLPGFTVYVIARPTSYAAQFPLATSDVGGGIKYDGTYMAAGAAGGVGQAQSWIKSPGSHVFGMIFDGTQTGNANRLKFRIDGTDQTLTFTGTVGTTTSASASYFFIGGENRSGVTLGFMDGYIGEVMMWTRTLTLSEQLGVESYLKQKWNIPGSYLSPSAATSGLMMYLDPGASTASTLLDQSGNYRNATLFNSPTITTGSGGYVQLNGTTQYFASPNLYNAANKSHTVEIWVRPAAANQNFYSDTSQQNTTTNYHYAAGQIYAGPVTNNTVISSLWSPTVTRVVNGARTDWLNNWWQIVKTYDGTTLIPYVNGVAGTSGSIAFDPPWGSVANSWYQCYGASDTTAYTGTTAGYNSGRFGIVRFYNRALTAAEVLSNYNSTKSVYGL